ncbi:Atg22p KNAG_0C00420 [Huiozyma naganishii CBS 8797]|uniref:Autophagy-related protein n=1 Tax=Huiozyma naganishii (strain ATCC MYA-139 / BCRC 22969 / CBS 8797 / KCTC 17520 / NBRC 10181 / NCYC 3082 / Yp74L-3) TaxID=1071383 RepID=J7S5H7_HUIN7|nr:hypothetical protein KNAG_0C00420 [Kazachstania naganishii CBS 8797]CCK69156.1 hypothetical protein KNAG_0C00420 [Kazachstania naganishii CBS 8797]
MESGALDPVDTAYLRLVKNNIKGWYFYSFSSEPFVVSVVSTYVPLLLEQFARANGVQLENHSRRCTPEHAKCLLPLFNKRLMIDTSSFPLYTFSISVLFQTVVVITVSGIVDCWNSVKFKGNVLVLFSIIGALATIGISRLDTAQFYTLPLLYIIANSCFGVINVVGNSLLPVFSTSLAKFDVSEVEDKLTSIISGRGASIGYSSALLVQLMSMLLINMSKTKVDVQIAVLLVGVWWLIWQCPMIWLFHDLPEQLTTHTEENSNIAPVAERSPYTNLVAKRRLTLKSLTYGWSSLWDAFVHARLLRDVMIFLLSWFIISDAITTINSTAILFSKTELHMTTLNLITISVLTMINAMIGAFVIPQFLSKKLNWLPHRTLIYIICWASFIPLYGMLGFVFDSIGLKHKFEMYILAVWYGISLGGLSAVSRSVFSLIIPKGKESTFFSLFSITDKGSSIVGPFLIGLVTDRTHNIRYAFYLLFALLLLSLPILEMLDVERGKREAQELSQIETSQIERLD